MKTLVTVLAMAGVCTCAPSAAQAALIDFQYSMYVNYTTGSPEAAFGRPVVEGNVLQGRVTWETTASDIWPTDSHNARYLFANGPSMITLDTPTQYVAQAVEVTVIDDVPNGDALFVAGALTFPGGGEGQLFIGISLPGSQWSTDSLPQTGLSLPPPPIFHPTSSVWLSTPLGGAYGYLLSFERLEPQPDPPNTVPEPTSLVLLGTGLLGAVRVGRRRLSHSEIH